jgi:hypothetical protein
VALEAGFIPASGAAALEAGFTVVSVAAALEAVFTAALDGGLAADLEAGLAAASESGLAWLCDIFYESKRDDGNSPFWRVVGRPRRSQRALHTPLPSQPRCVSCRALQILAFPYFPRHPLPQ